MSDELFIRKRWFWGEDDWPGYYQKTRKMLPQSRGYSLILDWTGYTNLQIEWKGGSWPLVEGEPLIQYREKVRRTVLQLLVYQFRVPRTKQPIDLTNYPYIYIQLKRQGVLFTIINGTIVNATLGNVESEDGYAFGDVGIWDAQFVAVSLDGKRIFGEPVQFKVVPNVEDLTLDELPTY